MDIDSLSPFNISKIVLVIALIFKEMTFVMTRKRRPAPNETSEHVTGQVTAFLNTFTNVPSHYCKNKVHGINIANTWKM